MNRTLGRLLFGFDYGEPGPQAHMPEIEAAPEIPRPPEVFQAIGSSQQFSDAGMAAIMSNVTGTTRDEALTLGTINRARDLICGALASVPLVLFQWDVDPEGVILGQHIIPPLVWSLTPDPTQTRGWIISNTVDDLIFYETAFWHVTFRYSNGFPASFEWLPYEWCAVTRDVTTKKLLSLGFNGADVPLEDVIEFRSPLTGVLKYGAGIIETCMSLEGSARRFARTEVPSGWLKQTAGEPYGPDELKKLAEGWNAARKVNATAALNLWMDWNEGSYDPEKLQLTQARDHSATEQARLMNVPPSLVAAPANNSMTYSNAEQAKQDLWDFTLFAYATCIEQTLSARALPARKFVRFDPTFFLRNPFVDQTGGTGTGVTEQFTNLNQTVGVTQ